MITASMLIPRLYGVSSAGGASGLVFDLLMDEKHEMKNVVTQHPVEDGSKITDHIHNELRTASLTGLVTNYSIKPTHEEDTDNWLKGIQERTKPGRFDKIFRNRSDFQSEGMNTLPLDEGSRYKDAYELLKALWRTRELVTIVTQMEVYEDVAITDISVERGAESGEAQLFKVSFQEMRVVKLKVAEATATIGVQDLGSPLGRQSAPTMDAGKQVGTNYAGQSAELQILLGGGL